MDQLQLRPAGPKPRRRSPWLWHNLSYAILGVLPWLGGSAPLPLRAEEAADQYRATIRPLMDRHCVSCHGSENPAEGLNLAGEKSRELIAPLRGVQTLDKLADRLRSQTMPPPDADPPLLAADRKALIAWIDQQIDRSLGGKSNPGRVTIRRLTRLDYRNTIRDLLAVPIDTGDFPSDDVAHGFDNLADVISLPPLLMERYADAAESIAADWSGPQFDRASDDRPLAEAAARDRAEGLLLPLQERAFRRPTTAGERRDLLNLFDQCSRDGFAPGEALQACVMRILISPSFLFRIEKDGPIGQDRQLDDFELATRLSYFLWSSMPDDELFAVARQGELQAGDKLARQVERMLRDPKTRQGLVENFAGQWLQTRRLDAIRPDRDLFPEFDEPLRLAMGAETLLLFETIVSENRPITELLDADYTFVNERLAKHYGISGVVGDAWQRVNLRDQPRRGVLTHASVLAINAHPTRTSPVLRGKWIMEAILGTPPPPPPADVGELDAVQIQGTLRERLDAHRADPRCAACHDRMDALGLAWENYDAIGAWRTKEAGGPIDPSGELADGGKFDNGLELLTLLRQRQAGAFRENLAEKLLVYALGRKLGMYDRLPLRRIVSRVEAGDDRFAELVRAIVASDVFRKRRNPGRIGIEKLPAPFVYELTGNPDQQAVLKVRRNPHEPPSVDSRRTSLELHTLKPLLGAGTAGAGQVSVGPAARERQAQQAYRYPLTVPLDEPVYLSFLRGMIGPHAYSDDFLKPIEPVAESDESRVVPVAASSHSWTGSLAGPANIRPGSLVAFDFDVRLVAKPRDSVTAFLATPGGTNSSMFANAGSFSVEGEGTHRLTQVGRRKPTTHDAWNDRLTLVITTRTQTVVGQVSPLHVIRPQLGLSDKSPIRFPRVPVGKPAESPQRQVWNAQQAVLTDHRGQPWHSLLYGTAQLATDPKRAYFVTTNQVGLELVGEHADRFELTGEHVIDGGRGMLLQGADGQPGLAGGPQPEKQPFQVRFRGAPRAGTYRATLRIVTQAGNLGTESTGQAGEPTKGLYYLDVPVEADVK